jgi:hypothetical protein
VPNSNPHPPDLHLPPSLDYFYFPKTILQFNRHAIFALWVVRAQGDFIFISQCLILNLFIFLDRGPIFGQLIRVVKPEPFLLFSFSNFWFSGKNYSSF